MQIEIKVLLDTDKTDDRELVEKLVQIIEEAKKH